jgi:ferredoxin
LARRASRDCTSAGPARQEFHPRLIQIKAAIARHALQLQKRREDFAGPPRRGHSGRVHRPFDNMDQPQDHPRIAREKRTIRAMIELWCRARHASGGELCPDCRELLDYAIRRLGRCPFGGGKPTCARCTIHCYQPAVREKAREVMRCAGPRMAVRHPILALRHQIDSLISWARGSKRANRRGSRVGRNATQNRNKEKPTMAKRKIVQIDEERCNGCGQCVPSCAEGAIQIIDGKAKLVSDVYCDGLGACLGTCPEDAIRIIERDAEAFDEEAARQHVDRQKPEHAVPTSPHACPGAAAQILGLNMAGSDRIHAGSIREDPMNRLTTNVAASPASGLGNWPVQLHLVPAGAPFLKDADLLLVADCVPFACADFHRRFLTGRPVVIGCPKLDDAPLYVDKLAHIITQASIRRITVVHMEVPCCTGLVRIAEAAIARSGRSVPLEDRTVSIRGQEIS